MATFSTGAAGVPTSRKMPGIYTQVVLGQGPSSPGGGPLRVLLLGNKTSAGTATVDTAIYDNLTPDRAQTLFGPGSELHLAVTAAVINEPAATVCAIAVTEATGTAASATITVANTATAGGTLQVWIHGVQINYAVTTGDTQTVAAAALSAAVNQLGTQLNVVATVSSAIVTITARHKGLRGNTIPINVVVDPNIGTQTFTVSAAKLASGAGQDTLTAALATAVTRRWDYIVAANIEQAGIQAVQAMLQSQSGPLVRKRGQAVFCVNDTASSTVVTLVSGVNDALVQLLWHKNGENLSFVTAAAWAATRSVLEQSNPNVHLSLMNSTVVDLFPWTTPPQSSANYMSDTDATAALDSGITPIIIGPDRHCRVALSITTHYMDALGAPDTRVLTTNMVSVPFAWADTVEILISSTFAGKYLADDVPGVDLSALPANTVTPSIVKGYLANVFNDIRQFGQFVGTPTEDVATWGFNLDSSNQNRMNATMQLHPLRWFTQFSSQVRQL